MRRATAFAAVLAALLALLALGTADRARAAERRDPTGLVRGARVESPDRVVITLSRPLARAEASNFRLSPQSAPDLPIAIREVRAEGERRIVLRAESKLDPQAAYRLDVLDPPARVPVRPSPWAVFLTVILSAALIQNFVFTRYLGLCIFFGVSRKRDTAIGMGVTFAAVMLFTGMFSWVLYRFVLLPLHLGFLQVILFIGVVAAVVQMLDTVLKKLNPGLHERFGIYLVLITTNCIILAVPLLNAAADAGVVESFALSMGAGAGFALALFLMSSARERVDLAQVPEILKGLPIAFALAGLFALAFMGFSGLSFIR